MFLFLLHTVIENNAFVLPLNIIEEEQELGMFLAIPY
jgi:hypothetical protein